MSVSLNTPIVLSEGNLPEFWRFSHKIIADPAITARLEADRLAPYLRALSKQLAQDLEKHPLFDEFTDQYKSRMQEITSPENLRTLYTKIARNTNSTILSEMMIVPDDTPNFVPSHDPDWNDYGFFQGERAYKRLNLTIGFAQARKDRRLHSVSTPYIGIDHRITQHLDSVLNQSAKEKYKAALKGLQTLATMGNHDMQHHYTNEMINDSIAKTFEVFPYDFTPDNQFEWQTQYFDSFPGNHNVGSYESWLVMNHARIQSILLEEDGARDALMKTCDNYYDALESLLPHIPEHPDLSRFEIAEYFNILAPNSLSRFLPLDDPIITHCIHCSKAIETSVKPKIDLAEYVLRQSLKSKDTQGAHKTATPKIVSRAIENYRSKGLNIPNPNEAKISYLDKKRIELLKMSSVVTHLLSPATQESDPSLFALQNRVGQVNLDMIDSVSHGMWNSPVENGTWDTTDQSGAKIRIHTKDGKPHKNDGPAIEYTHPLGTTYNLFCENGKMITEPSKQSPPLPKTRRDKRFKNKTP